jgi:arsenate reductase
MNLSWSVRRGVLAAAVAGMFVMSAVSTASSQTHTTVLFMCPHGAAKSVLASAYFHRAAKERGLNVRVLSAGIDPDTQVAPAVVAHLKRSGYDVPIPKPQRATAHDLSTADVVISIGCDLTGLPAPTGMIVRWDDVPAPSEDFARADATIKERVVQLVDELVRKQR